MHMKTTTPTSPAEMTVTDVNLYSAGARARLAIWLLDAGKIAEVREQLEAIDKLSKTAWFPC